MPKSDHEFFNCSEEHELVYVSSLYKETAKVKEALIKMCKDNTIKNSTHAQVYKLLEDQGFERK